MATKWCPECRSEYREGFNFCGDCGAALVDALPPLAEPDDTTAPPEFHERDDVVELVTLGIVEAELIAAQLRVAGIPAAIFGTGAEIYVGARQGRVMVRRSDLADAEQFVDQLSAEERSGTPIADEDLATLAEESAGGSDPGTGAVV